jgi:TolB protein
MKRCLQFSLLVLFLLALLCLSCNSASEGKIAFVSDFEQPGQHYFVYVMDPDGSNQIKLGEIGILRPECLQWSPDGKRIAFGTCGLKSNKICIANADGKNLLEVGPPVSEDCVISALSWSPDGGEIAVAGLRWQPPPEFPPSPTMEIYVINVESDEARQLTNAPDTEKHEVAWSPDGTQIAFISINRDSPEYCGVYVIDAGGSNQRLLVSPPKDHGLGQISWSPDGKKLMYVSSVVAGEIESYYGEIYVVDVEDGTTINLTNTPDIDDRDPAWSPDGKKIAFSSGGLGPNQIHIMDVDGSNVVKLTHEALGCSQPSWSPDGKKIVFSAGKVHRPGGGEKGWYSLFIVDVDSREVVDLIATGLGDYEFPVWSPR